MGRKAVQTPFARDITISVSSVALATLECLVQTGLYGSTIQEAAERVFFKPLQDPQLSYTLFGAGMYDRPTYERAVAGITAAITDGNIGSRAGEFENELNRAKVAAVQEYLTQYCRGKLAVLPPPG